MNLSRRGFFGFLAAPAIVRATSLMPISAILSSGPVGDAFAVGDAFMQLYKQEFIAAFEKSQSILRAAVSTEGTGRNPTFLISGVGGVEAGWQ